MENYDSKEVLIDGLISSRGIKSITVRHGMQQWLNLFSVEDLREILKGCSGKP